MKILTKQQNVSEDNKSASEEQIPGRRAEYFLAPLADVEWTDSAYTIRAEMPGVNKANLEISVDKGELSIIGRRQLETPPGEPVHLEIQRADYHRVYEIDPAVEPDKITARVEQGILTLTLPKPAPKQPLKITVD